MLTVHHFLTKSKHFINKIEKKFLRLNQKVINIVNGYIHKNKSGVQKKIKHYTTELL